MFHSHTYNKWGECKCDCVVDIIKSLLQSQYLITSFLSNVFLLLIACNDLRCYYVFSLLFLQFILKFSYKRLKNWKKNSIYLSIEYSWNLDWISLMLINWFLRFCCIEIIWFLIVTRLISTFAFLSRFFRWS